jgi:hypothetical protein
MYHRQNPLESTSSDVLVMIKFAEYCSYYTVNDCPQKTSDIEVVCESESVRTTALYY